MAITSKQINLVQLDQELGSKGLVANFEDSEAKLINAADGSDVTEEQLETAITNHQAILSEPTIADKLASVGLSLDELKAAILGGN